MRNILKFIIQNKTAYAAYIIMFVSLIMTLCFIFIGNEIMVEVLGIFAIISLTTGVLIELLILLIDK